MVTFTTIHQVFPLRFTAQQADILEYYSPSFYYNKDDSRHQRIFSVFTEGLLFTHTI